MEPTNIKILSIENATHDVRRIRTVKPPDLNFTPGQAADISINKEGWGRKRSDLLLLPAFRKMTSSNLPSRPILRIMA